MKENSILITGASGLLGREVRRLFSVTGFSVTGTAHSRAKPGLVCVDLADAQSVARLVDEVRPAAIINCAAERRPDACEAETPAVARLNIGLPAQLAELAEQKKFLLIQISTDYVFDGTLPPYPVDARPHPLNAYGRQKFAAEEAIRKACRDAAILRMPILYGPTEDLSESAITVIAANLLRAKGAGVPMDDLAVRYPTLTTDVARQLLAMVKDHRPEYPIEGIYHYSGNDAMTKYAMALTMVPFIGCQAEQCIPDYRPPTVPRPRDCHLDTARLRERGIFIDPTSFVAGIATVL